MVDEWFATNGNSREKKFFGEGRNRGGILFMSLGIYYLLMHVQWSCQLLQSELFSVFKLKGESKNIHDAFDLTLVPRTEPIMTAAMNTIVNRVIGMMNLLRCQ